MSSKAVVPDFQGCSFKGIDLSRYLIEWKDTRQNARAVHRYPKRRGGEAEPMARQPHQAKLVLAFVGASWRKDFLKLQASVDDDPLGVLIHPLYGSMRAHCDGHLDAGMNIETAPGLYSVPLLFIEDAVDTKVESQQSQGPSAKKQQVNDRTSSLGGLVAKLSAASAAIEALMATADSYASTALAAAQSNSADASLPRQLDQVRVSAEVARAAIRSDPAVRNDAGAYDALLLCEQVYDACVQLDDSVAAQKPTLGTYVVPATIHIAALARQFYGSDGADRVDEIRANNPGRLPSPYAIPAGTELLLATPTR